MIATKERIKNNLEFLNEQQLQELADYTAFLKIRTRIQNSNVDLPEHFSKYLNEDRELAELGIAEYNNALLEEDKL